ncbi:hypothetical protein BAS10_18545 [Elizabethkingia meningoseptica]|uniref:hypothetical protein n=1 Tax=Elizabethkingia meningoseptica TaxID=238 RepID=UPI000999DA6E|nr:hypothetical protein [Elizabethkingia meningoseptica]OPC01943.1 hypothetical protein BAS10_18545 [Elizabethkingia meningoseptica]
MNTNSNNAAQTLFHFTNLRNPQLAEAPNNDNFILRDAKTTGYFDDLAQEWSPAKGISKIDFFLEKLIGTSLPTTIKKTEEELKVLLGDFFEAGKKLAQKRNWETIADINALMNALKTKAETTDSAESKLLDPASVEVKTLWDSLIYQMLTQEGFYTKEVVIQSLQAVNYYVKFFQIEEEDQAKKRARLQKIASAKVVIPSFLLIDTVTKEESKMIFTVNETKIGKSYIFEKNSSEQELSEEAKQSFIKQQSLDAYQQKKLKLEGLNTEIGQLDTVYNKSVAKSYDAAVGEFQKTIQPLQSAYRDVLLDVEATFTENMTEAQKKQALNAVPKPDLPEFTFDAPAQRDLAVLKNKLSEPSLELFAALIGTPATEEEIANNGIKPENILELGEQYIVFPDDQYLNFGEIKEVIGEHINDINNGIITNTDLNQISYVSIGGVLIPTQTINTEQLDKIKYNGMLTSRLNGQDDGNHVEMALSIKVDKDIPVEILSYRLVSESGIVKKGSSVTINPYYSSFSCRDFFENNLMENEFGKYSKFIIECKINGQRLQATVDNYRGYIGDRDVFFYLPDHFENDDNANSFIPSGFGIKRLGISDYLRVEQSTHAYVEGEVANIENIMAREYRDKSTRRLRKSEVTETFSSDSEKEQLTDTTTTERFEMQSEVAKVLQESTDMGINTNTAFNGSKFQFSTGASFANHRSKEESVRNAVTQAQDITVRALDRVVRKVHEERIEKIIEEFEENNSHGFDNRKGDKHVVGVYRWVDKLMKNQVQRYGKRLMFEFAIPQPAKLHSLAMKSLKGTKIIEMPIDPRKSSVFTMKDFSTLNDENTLKYWQSKYNVEIEKQPENEVRVTKSISVGMGETTEEMAAKSDSIEIPEGYTTLGGWLNVSHFFHPSRYEWTHISVSVGDFYKREENNLTHLVIDQRISFKNRYSKSVGFAFESGDTAGVAMSVSLDCTLNKEVKDEWLQKAFIQIIRAYEDAMVEYNQKIAEESEKASEIKGANPLFYRQIEQEILKHNCIAYLLDDGSQKSLGKKMYEGDDVKNFQIKREQLDQYAALAKFMEQAFEWEIISYNYYPYYWGDRNDWGTMYQSENIDPLFRSFLRSGMARVVVTVRPGFEDAVQYYMVTGKIWNGGEVPVIGDPLYLSIVDELKETEGETYGKAWITRIPTPLTILQAESIGLKVEHALPFTQENPEDFEDPKALVTESNFEKNNATMQAPDSKAVGNMEINNDYLQLTTADNPKQVVAQLSLDDLKEALQ